jgi:putative acetyltransferase
MQNQPTELELTIVTDDLSRPEVIEFVTRHFRGLTAITPPDSCHVLDIDALRRPDITFWTAWHGQSLAGCGALKRLSPEQGEIKSMRTAEAWLRKGVASAVLAHMIAEAQRRGYRYLNLETGSGKSFEPAQQLYRRFGFVACPPFGSYREDPNSVFMAKELSPNSPASGA